jgi:hypothetical protein
MNNTFHELHGHWFCSFCNDVVNLRKPYGRWDQKRGVCCPVCHNRSADWIGRKPTPPPVTPAFAAEHFEKIRKAIE